MDKKKSIYIISIISLSVLVVFMIKILSKDRENRPNIVVITLDNLSAETLSCYGGHFIQTPNLDQLANEGIRFDSCFSGNYDDSQSKADFTKLLFKHGYQTAFFGKKSSSNNSWTLSICPLVFHLNLSSDKFKISCAAFLVFSIM